MEGLGSRGLCVGIGIEKRSPLLSLDLMEGKKNKCRCWGFSVFALGCLGGFQRSVWGDRGAEAGARDVLKRQSG